MLQAVQRILQFTHELVSQLGMTRRDARGLKIRNRTDLVALRLAGNLSEIPPRALLFLELLLLNRRLLRQRKPVLDETRQRIAFDNTDHVEVEISAVPRGRFRMESQCTFQRDLPLKKLDDLTGMQANSALLLNGSRDRADHFPDLNSTIGQQVFKHPNRITHHQTAVGSERGNGAIQRQPVRRCNQLTFVQSENSVVGQSKRRHSEPAARAELERPSSE